MWQANSSVLWTLTKTHFFILHAVIFNYEEIPIEININITEKWLLKTLTWSKSPLNNRSKGGRNKSARFFLFDLRATSGSCAMKRTKKRNKYQYCIIIKRERVHRPLQSDTYKGSFVLLGNRGKLRALFLGCLLCSLWLAVWLRAGPFFLAVWQQPATHKDFLPPELHPLVEEWELERLRYLRCCCFYGMMR